MKRFMLLLLITFSFGIQLHAQNYLDIYKDGKIVSSVTAADVDSMVVGNDPNNRTLYFYHGGEFFHRTTTANIDSIKIFRTEDEPFVYLSIVGFNQVLYEKPLGILDMNKANDYKAFVDNLTRNDGSLLYYGVDHALDMLESKAFPSQVASVNLITFTDGLDQGSLMMNSNYTTEEQYLNAISDRIKNIRVKGLPLTAYSLGLRGSDVTDYNQFQKNLQQLASSSDKALEVNSMSAVRDCLQSISEQIVSVSNKQTISLKIPGQSNGTLIRFTFDGYSPTNSTLFIEGTFNLSDRSLRDVTYHGLKAESGSVIQGKQEGIFVTFTFTGLQHEDGNGQVPTNNIHQYYKSPSSETWQENSEFTPANNVQSSITHSGSVIMLVLDCSSSLGSQFSNMQSYVNDFINNIANNAYVAEEIERPFGNCPIGSGETFVVNGVSFKMVKVSGGTFQMGATSEQGSDAYDGEYPVHQVTLSDYYIGETEVTEGLWRAVMGSNPSRLPGSDQHPVEYFDRQECSNFINKLNQLTGQNFRLPTEAEWEFAARGGNYSKGYKYAGSNQIDEVAWYYDNSSHKKHAVGTKSPNELGLYDMSGNVWEWCKDYYGSYSSNSQTNPTGPSSSSYLVIRGGGYRDDAGRCRVSSRGGRSWWERDAWIGLRLAK